MCHRSRRFDCILLVFFRRWSRLVIRDSLLWLVVFQQLWLVHFDPCCSLSDLLPRRCAVARLSCCCAFWSWASTLLEFLFHYPCWCCQGEVLCELFLWPCACKYELLTWAAQPRGMVRNYRLPEQIKSLLMWLLREEGFSLRWVEFRVNRLFQVTLSSIK